MTIQTFNSHNRNLNSNLSIILLNVIFHSYVFIWATIWNMVSCPITSHWYWILDTYNPWHNASEHIVALIYNTIQYIVLCILYIVHITTSDCNECDIKYKWPCIVLYNVVMTYQLTSLRWREPAWFSLSGTTTNFYQTTFWGRLLSNWQTYLRPQWTLCPDVPWSTHPPWSSTSRDIRNQQKGDIR